MKRFLLFIVVLYSLHVQAGDNVRVKGHKFIILPFVSGIWQRSFFGEAELGHVYNIHFVSHHFGRTILVYSKLGGEFNLNFKHELWAPKFSSEIDLGFICIRANIENYMQNRTSKIYGTPDIGLTLAGFITVCCGYNEPLFNAGFQEIKRIRISASLMLPFKLSGSSKYKKQ